MKTKITRKRTEIITLEVEVDVPEGVNTEEGIIAIAEAVELPTQTVARLACLLTGAQCISARSPGCILNGKATVVFTFEKDLPIPGEGKIAQRRITPQGLYAE